MNKEIECEKTIEKFFWGFPNGKETVGEHEWEYIAPKERICIKCKRGELLINSRSLGYLCDTWEKKYIKN